MESKFKLGVFSPLFKTQTRSPIHCEMSSPNSLNFAIIIRVLTKDEEHVQQSHLWIGPLVCAFVRIFIVPEIPARDNCSVSELSCLSSMGCNYHVRFNKM